MSVTINGTNGLTFSDASTQNTAATGFGFKNRIINGDMRIDQRNAGAEVNPAVGGTYAIDRWRIASSAASKFKIQQNAGGVTPPAGFKNYLGCTSLSAYAPSGSESFAVNQRIEGFNIADLNWGTANAKAVTLSFWVRSSLTGTFGGSLRNSTIDRSYPFSYTISSANTWEQKSVVISGDTTGTWLTDNGIGINTTFSIGAGSTSATTAGAWASGNYTTVTGAVDVVGTNGATLYITGVQLEKGSTATSFDYRPYGTELALCQRYYQVFSIGIYAGRGNSTTAVIYGLPVGIALRASPTITTTGVAYVYPNQTSGTGTSTVLNYDAGDMSMRVSHSGWTGLTDNAIYNLQFSNKLLASAEL